MGADLLRHHARAERVGAARIQVGSEVLSVVLLRMWENGQAEAVSVIGLMMMLLVFVFRWVQLRLIKRYISTLRLDLPCQNSFSKMSRVPSVALSRSPASTCGSMPASSSPCSDPPAAAKPRRCAWWPGSEESTGGRISIGARVVNDPAKSIHLPPDRRRLGMVFQSYAIWPHMRVFDNVAYPLRVRRRPEAEIRQRVEKALTLVEMDHFADRPAPALSGGQQQRVAIARALVFEPEVLLLDEPLSNLDARLRAQMGDEFRSLQKRLGITTLYVTHDQDEAMALSDRVVLMRSGKILQVGAAAGHLSASEFGSRGGILWRTESAGRHRDDG